MTLWLERKYLSMVVSHLANAKWKDDKLLNHSCPYCGDSKTNDYKARGYHFVVEQSYVYKCHNCGVSTSSVKFLKEHFPTIHLEYRKEFLQETGKRKSSRKMPSSSKYRFTPRTKILNKIDNISKYCQNAWEVAESKSYLIQRKIPQTSEIYYVDNTQLLSKLHTKYKDRVLGNNKRIILPFYRNGELIGVTGRAIDDSQLRYLTMRFLDDTPLIYNYDKVDKTKTIYVTEGPIDSLFLPNSIAVAGSDFKKIDEDIKKTAILIYDNEPRNTQILKKLDEVIDLGYSVCLWFDKRVKNYKDINEMILNGLSKEEVLEIINKNTYTGLQAKLKLKEYTRYG